MALGNTRSLLIGLSSTVILSVLPGVKYAAPFIGGAIGGYYHASSPAQAPKLGVGIGIGMLFAAILKPDAFTALITSLPGITPQLTEGIAVVVVLTSLYSAVLAVPGSATGALLHRLA